MDSRVGNTETWQHPFCFVWGEESTTRRLILKNPLPEKRHKSDNDEESTLPDESLDEDMLVKHVLI